MQLQPKRYVGTLNRQHVVHTGPCFTSPTCVVMCRLTWRGDRNIKSYLIEVWEVGSKKGLSVESDYLIRDLWGLTAPILSSRGINLNAVILDLKSAITTMASEMDQKTNDCQRYLAELGNPQIIQRDPEDNE